MIRPLTSTQQAPAKEGGYDYQFVEEPPESLKCLICLLVARDPQQHGGCGKLFCKTCIAKYRGNNCPHCRQGIRSAQTQRHYTQDLWGQRPSYNNYQESPTNTTVFNDFKSGQEVKALRVFCKTECGWKGSLGSVELHETRDCENTEVSCLNSCNTKVKRKDLQLHLKSKCSRRLLPCHQCKENIEFRNKNDHVANKCLKRQYTCPHCNKAGVYDEQTTTHLTVCPKVKVKCSKCSIQVFRCYQSNHIAVCQYEPVHCKYYSIGCGEKPLRKNLIKHEENAQLHLELATDKILSLTKMLLLKNTVTFKATGFAHKKFLGHCSFSPDFFTSESGYKMCLRVDANGCGEGAGTHVSVFACLMKGDHDDTLTWPFTGSVTFELLNQLEDKNHYKRAVTFPADNEASKRVVVSGTPSSGYGSQEFISHTALDYNVSTNTQYLKDDTLVFRVSAEAPDHKPWLECTGYLHNVPI